MEIKQSLPPHRLCKSTSETTSEPPVTARILKQNLIAQYFMSFSFARAGVFGENREFLLPSRHILKEFIRKTTVDIGEQKEDVVQIALDMEQGQTLLLRKPRVFCL
jgi:hypothetical protein